MALFGKSGFGMNILGGGVIDKGPSIGDKVNMIFKDVETEGKKQGYERASKEYSKAFYAIENEYKETKELIEKQKEGYDTKSEILISKLERLEKQKAELRKQLNQNAKDISIKYNIPVSSVTKTLDAGTLVVNSSTMIDVLGIIYNHKEKKLKEAEQRGYVEAKKIYEEKISRLKNDLQELKEKGNREVQELLDLINDLFNAISEEQMKIAELRILL